MENRMIHHGSGRDGEKTIVDVDFETFSCRVIVFFAWSLDAPTGENRRKNVQKVQGSGMVLTPYKQDYKKLRDSFVASHMPYRSTYEYTQLSRPAIVQVSDFM